MISTGKVKRLGELQARLGATQRPHLAGVLEEFRALGWLSDSFEWTGPAWEGEVQAFRGNGDPNSYPAVHQRHIREHGPASAHKCAGCGGRASAWAYNHQDPNEVYGPSKIGRSDRRAYSLSFEFYRPLCVSCHNDEDKPLAG